jgi:proline iminopeptidase
MLTANIGGGARNLRDDARMGAGAENGRRITEHGLYADIRGAAGAPPLLFLHGGPGQGCADFMAIQGDLLGGPFRLIGIDQRGVDRSAPLPVNGDSDGRGAGLTIADLVGDCEAVREELGIERWAVLGQSFGGALALRYAAAHPAAVSAAVFENPVWDLAASARAALPRVALMLTERGRRDAARAALAAAGRERSARPLRAAYVAALEALGEDREVFFVPDPATRARLAQIRRSHARPDGAAGDEGSLRHHRAITTDAGSYEPLLGLLPRLTAPALLITGGYDPLTSPGQRDAFRRASPRHQLLEVPGAGHFVHADDSLSYASAVTDFLRSCAADLSRSGGGQVPATGS